MDTISSNLSKEGLLIILVSKHNANVQCAPSSKKMEIQTGPLDGTAPEKK